MTKKYFINSLITYFLFSNIFAQVSSLDINRLSNSQLDALKTAISNKSATSDFNSSKLDDTIKPEVDNTIILKAEKAIDESPYFGYSYFKRDINFFDNIPTPSDFRLGPGDEIILSMWGETNLRESFTINKDGMIYYSNIGFINLSNKNLREAELLLVEELSRIYSTLKSKNNSTKLMLELGQLKSINVYFSGHIENPGISLIHPFSDIFSAIVQSGGINKNGSLRDVKLIRNGKTIISVDFYSFFMSGKNNFSNIKLIDGDVIHIPDVKKRINISGEVKRPHIYELLNNESISDLVGYASGFTSNASSNLILNQIIPAKERLSDDFSRSSTIINYKNIKSIILNNGDSIFIPPIPEVDLEASVYGRVKSPGNYPVKNSTLKTILDLAGGFDDPVYRKSIEDDQIIILRNDENNFYGKEIYVSYQDAGQFEIEANDKIFVYERTNYSNAPIYEVKGQVYKPGTYPFKNNITIGEALSLAGGITEFSSERNIILEKNIFSVDEFGKISTSLKRVNSVTLDTKLEANTIIKVLEVNNIVFVDGNVFNSSVIDYQKGTSLKEYIELAGGLKPNSMRDKIYVKRANGEIKTLKKVFFGPRIKIYPGDSIFVPVDPDPQDFDITSFLADLSSTLANLVAILLIIDNQNT